MSEEKIEQNFAIQKIYLKDSSFESPNSPDVFSASDWKPEINVQLNSSNNSLGENLYEVILSITITAKKGDKVGFLVEVKQAGVFLVSGFEKDALGAVLGSLCLETIFPFAREAVSDLVGKGGFPQLLLAPVNFNALYTQHIQQKNTAAAEQDVAH